MQNNIYRITCCLLASLITLTSCSSPLTETAHPASPEATKTATEFPAIQLEATKISPTSTLIPEETTPTNQPEITESNEKEAPPSHPVADVISVAANGEENTYQFSVEISSPDKGCQQYTDWWEVLNEDGILIYRRILTHSHVNEQPFTRSGGPVEISAETIVIVRAHMNPDGYGGVAFKGSLQDGFEEIQLEPGFADEIETSEPLPTGCAF